MLHVACLDLLFVVLETYQLNYYELEMFNYQILPLYITFVLSVS